MENLFSNYSLPPRKKRADKRADLVKMFVDKINLGRVNTKFKPVDPKGVAILINQHPNLKSDTELWDFYGRCKEAKSFSAYFYWVVKPKK